MTQRPIGLLKYSFDKFINRQEEIEKVMKKANALMQGSPADNKRTIIFAGERGTGKTWLLDHLQKIIRSSFPAATVFKFDLSGYADRDPTWAVLDILKRLNAMTEKQDAELGTSPADMSRNLMHKIQPLLRKKGLFLLVDHVYESDWKLLAALEEYLLGPLAVEPRVLIVMAGRGRPYPWKRPELRLKAEFVDLKPFPDVATTTEQLKCQQEQALARAAEIHNLSGGNPLANFLLAAQDNTAAALDQVVDGMLDTVPKEHRQRVRKQLEALSVLRAFDEERIPTMLATYYNEDQRLKWSYAQSRGVREELVKWAFAHWDADRGGYVLDELTRKLLERYLQIAQPDRWKRLQQTASKLYGEWAHDYPRTRERWQQEVRYHDQQLQAN